MNKFQQGYNNYHDGFSIDDNPYRFGTREYTSWFDGWNHAELNELETNDFSPID